MCIYFFFGETHINKVLSGRFVGKVVSPLALQSILTPMTVASTAGDRVTVAVGLGLAVDVESSEVVPGMVGDSAGMLE